ncbi:tetratricopeptide repeat protein [Rubritalea tangerina]|uniref:Tetratricopeptide repeat protein n=1 Tax=Rubritalea tangerina TaxID=430798 RepID=A0ABW4ZBS9_9BACT
MGTPTPTSPAAKRPAFTIACGLFACVSFAQLLSVGVAIAARTGETREVVRYVKGDPLIVSVPTLRDEVSPTPSVQPRSLEELLSDYAEPSDSLPTENSPPIASFPQPSLAPSTPETAPTIASPEVKKLVDDAHHAHSKGDMVAALIKLEEASALAPDEPAVFYRMALLFEDMGQWERATDNYEKLFVMGPSIGVYYDKAAFKLSNGINAENPKQDLFVIGHIMRRISDDGLNARLTIPIRSTPGAEFDPTQINVVVHHYDLVDKQRIEPIPPSRANNKTERWLHAPVDWANDEEIAEASYTLPPLSEAETHLFGERKYFGYVAELYYKNELIDQQAYPRRLHAIHAQKQNQPDFDIPLDFPVEEALPNINPDNPLLPALPRY